MQNLNYSRQMVKQFSNTLKIPNCPLETKETLSHYIDLAHASQKFMMPPGGRLIDDKEFKALDDSEPLRLPFPMIAIEYQTSEFFADGPMSTGQSKVPKRIAFCRERDDYIVISVAFWYESAGIWVAFGECALPLTGYLDRNSIDSNGRVGIRLKVRDSETPLSDFADEVGALLDFLNALQCSNVEVEKIPLKKTALAMRKAIPFDEYHVLAIKVSQIKSIDCGAKNGLHRSPREHLRRGHIRRYANGSKIWVNAAVVNAGIGGKISKDYRLAA